MSTMNKVLIAALLLVALVAMFELASAQYYGGYGGRGGYGYGGRGGYGGGYGRGGYGGGYGRGGYGGGYGRGGYGGGYGRGGYGGGYRGYRGDSYDSYDSNSYSPIGSTGGYYDQAASEDDYSSAADGYAASSSSFKPAVAQQGAQQPQHQQPGGIPNFDQQPQHQSPVLRVGVAGGVNQAANNWQPQDQSSQAQQPWDLAGGQGQHQLVAGNNQFDLMTGSQLFGTSLLAGSDSKARERNVLAKQLNESGPKVPSSTTTAAPEYVMINPTGRGSGSAGADDADQEE